MVFTGWFGGWLVEELFFVLGNDIDDCCGINVTAIGFGVDSDEDYFVLGFEVVEDTITAAFASLDIAVFEADFVDDRFDTLNTIAGGFSLEKLVDQRL